MSRACSRSNPSCLYCRYVLYLTEFFVRTPPNGRRVVGAAVFTYGPPHTVDELPSEADYKACSFDNSVSSDQSGSTAVTFDKAGTRYFACAAASHCSQGQKVAITTAGAGASPAPKPKENSAATAMAGLAVKLALGLGVGGAVLAAF